MRKSSAALRGAILVFNSRTDKLSNDAPHAYIDIYILILAILIMLFYNTSHAKKSYGTIMGANIGSVE